MLKKGDDPFLQARPYEYKTHPALGSARGRRGEGAEPAAVNGFQGASIKSQTQEPGPPSSAPGGHAALREAQAVDTNSLRK